MKKIPTLFERYAAKHGKKVPEAALMFDSTTENFSVVQKAGTINVCKTVVV